MADNGTGGPSAAAGRIGDGPYSTALKREVARLVRICAAFDACESPSIPYIAAWSETESALWYEFGGRGLAALLGEGASDLADRFRRSVVERRVYRQQHPEGPIAEEVLREEQLSGLRPGLRCEVRRRGCVEALYKIAPPGGATRWVKDSATVRGFPADAICLSLGCLTDVSKEMEAEEERRRLEAEKGRLERELEQLGRLEALGGLAAGIGRRFGELLAGIGRACTALLAADPALPPFDRYRLLKEIEAQVEAGSGLIQQLMALAGAGRRDPLPSDLGEIARQAILPIQCTRPDLAIALHRPPDLWSTEVDRSQIGEVIGRLCLRLLEAAPGLEALHLDLSNQDLASPGCTPPPGLPPGPFVELTMRGVGVRLEENACRRIFAPLLSLSPENGLTSTYGLLRGNGGALQVDCHPEGDLTFRLLLPASPAPAPSTPR